MWRKILQRTKRPQAFDLAKMATPLRADLIKTLETQGEINFRKASKKLSKVKPGSQIVIHLKVRNMPGLMNGGIIPGIAITTVGQHRIIIGYNGEKHSIRIGDIARIKIIKR